MPSSLHDELPTACGEPSSCPLEDVDGRAVQERELGHVGDDGEDAGAGGASEEEGQGEIVGAIQLPDEVHLETVGWGRRDDHQHGALHQ